MIRETDLRNNQSNSSPSVFLTVLGTRGSMPVSGAEFAGYGCATSCYLFEAGDEAIILDAGNGILNLPDPGDRNVSLIITHSHLDHILGLPSFLGTMGGKELTIYGAVHEGKTISQQLDELLKRPLWPIGIDVYGVKIRFVDLEEGAFAGDAGADAGSFKIGADAGSSRIGAVAGGFRIGADAGSSKHGADADSFKIGDVTVSAMPSNHPGESTVIGLEYDGRKIVYATDFEHTAKGQDGDLMLIESLSLFSKDADLILYDGQYAPEEYGAHSGFGHSTYEVGIRVKEKAGARAMRIIHHAPGHRDEFLGELDRRIAELDKAVALAREGDRYIL